MSDTRRGRFFIAALSIAFVLSALLLAGCAAGRAGEATADPPPVVYIGWDAAGRNQLYRVDGLDRAPQRLTGDEGGDVAGFAVSPDARRIAYAFLTDAGGSVLRLLDLRSGESDDLLACADAECGEPVWLPDGRRLLYERREKAGTTPGQPHLWWLDVQTGRTIPLLEGDRLPTSGARFSPDGAWLSYVSPRDGGVILYNLSDGRQHLLPAAAGRPAAWSPDGRSLIVADLSANVQELEIGGQSGDAVHQETAHTYLYRVDLANLDSRTRLSPQSPVDDSAPTWSPDGEMIAFGRTLPETAAARQLWLMGEDGSDARALTGDSALQHGPPAWSLDGRFLLFQRFEADAPDARPGIWLLEATNGSPIRLVENGFLPAWLPQP